MCVCIYMRVFIYIYIYIYIHTHTHTHCVYTFMCTHTHACKASDKAVDMHGYWFMHTCVCIYSFKRSGHEQVRNGYERQ